MKPIMIILGVGIFAITLAIVLIKLGLPGGVVGGVVFFTIFFGSMIIGKSLKKK